MIHKTYEFVCQLPVEAASERIAGLLSKEGVEYSTRGFSITSVRTPVAVFGFQPTLYSHSNWVGLNPFTFITGVDVQFEKGDNGGTRVAIRVDRRRAFLWVAFWVTCSLMAGTAMPEPGGAILVIGVTCAAWFGIVSFLGGYLIKKEINERLKDAV